MKWAIPQIGIYQGVIRIWLPSIISNGFAESWGEIFGFYVVFEYFDFINTEK